MPKRHKPINIGDTDKNADWIKTPENRKSERKVHDRLVEEYEKEHKK